MKFFGDITHIKEFFSISGMGGIGWKPSARHILYLAIFLCSWVIFFAYSYGYRMLEARLASALNRGATLGILVDSPVLEGLIPSLSAREISLNTDKVTLSLENLRADLHLFPLHVTISCRLAGGTVTARLEPNSFSSPFPLRVQGELKGASLPELIAGMRRELPVSITEGKIDLRMDVSAPKVPRNAGSLSGKISLSLSEGRLRHGLPILRVEELTHIRGGTEVTLSAGNLRIESLSVESGDIAVYNTTGGAMAVAGMVLAANYFDRPEYLQAAREAAEDYYASFALTGFTSGGCGDILQNADSETAIALTTSMITLYEATGEPVWLERAKDVANLCATWTVSFPYRLPDNTPLAKLGANLTGAVWASTQNKHGAPGFCTQSGDALLKLYRATGDTLYAALLRDIIHAHAEGVQPNGKITERLTYCDADSRGSRGDGGQTGWNETNGALMAVEIPGIYLRTDLDRCYVFDHVTIQKTERDDRHITLTLHNPTAFDATVTILAENAAQAALPLGDNAFLQWNDKVTVKAGRTAKIKIPR